MATTTYTLTATNASGSATATATVAVTTAGTAQVTFAISPGNTDSVYEGAVRSVYGNVCSGAQSQGCTPPGNLSISWAASCGSLSYSSGPYVTWTAPNTTGTCTVTGTAVAGGSPATQTYTVIADSINVDIVPFYIVLFKNQIALLQPIVSGTTNKNITWSTTGGTLTHTPLTASFSTATPGTYTVTATAYDGITTGTAKIIVTNDALPSTPTINHTEPVDCVAEGSGTTYTVSSNADLDSVPWTTLGPGDTIIVNYNATPYSRQFILGFTSGTATQPIRMCGIPDPTNGLPMFSGSGAQAVRAFNNSSGSFWGGTIAGGGQQQFTCCLLIFDHANVGGNDVSNGYFVVEGLKFSQGIDAADAEPDSPGYTFFPVEAPSTPTAYSPATECLRIQNSHDVVIRGLELTDCGNGIFVNDQEYRGSATNYVLFQGNYVHMNGATNFDTVHALYLQGTGYVIQGNYLGTNRTNAQGTILKTRIVSKYIRYNYFTQRDTAYILDMDEPENEISGSSSSRLFTAMSPGPGYTTAQIAPQEELYSSNDWVYGNIFNNQAGGAAIDILYGADDLPQACPDSKLWFYNNSDYDQITSSTSFYMAWFNLSAGGTGCTVGGPGTMAPREEATNNAMWMIGGTPGSGAPYFNWAAYEGAMVQIDTNWIDTNWCTYSPSSACGVTFVSQVSGTNVYCITEYQSACFNTHLVFNPSVAGALITGNSAPFSLTTFVPNNNSVLTGSQSLPSAISNLPVNMEYSLSSFTMVSRPNTNDMGAEASTGGSGPSDSSISPGVRLSTGTTIQ